MDHVLTFIFGVIAASIGYLAKRWFEGQNARDKIQDVTSLVRLHRELKSENVSLAALEQLKEDLLSRNQVRSKNEAEVVGRIEASLKENKITDEIGASLQTQVEMNQYALHLADLAERELNFLAMALESRLDEFERQSFEKLQKTWRKYAEAEAEFASLSVRGGSMQPMLRSAELRALIIERAARLKDQIRERAEDTASVEVVPEKD